MNDRHDTWVNQSAENGDLLNCLFIVPSLKRAGAESQLIEVANRLDGTRFRKTMVVLENNLDQLDKVDTNSVDVLPVPKKSRLDLGQVRKIAELIDDRAIDVIHATIQYSVFIASLARLWARRKPKLVAAIHTTKNVGLKEELFDRIVYRPMLWGCQHIIFVCTYQRDYWLSRFPELGTTSSVIYNGVDSEVFRREHHEQRGKQFLRELGVPEGQFVIACIAGFREEKGHDILIEAFSGLPDKARLLLAGDGVTRGRMEALVSSMGIGGRVYFLGNMPDVRPLLSVSDVMVLASTAVETFSMAMLESMSMEVPVIASDIGGLREAIEEGVTGTLVPPRDSGKLKEAIRQYMTAGNLFAIRKKCREAVQDRFTADGMVSLTESRLTEVAARQ
jgi:glycosyltransferase involved in cell wall biosynthesis